MSEVDIRPLAQRDRADWAKLWTQYLTYHEAELPSSIYDTTWERLLSDNEHEFSGLIAHDRDGKALGGAHFVFHRDTWSVENVCYLHDLFVDEGSRGGGVGRALIEAVCAAAKSRNAIKVYWTTRHYNANARALYDKVAELTPFVVYNHALSSA